MTTDNPRSSAPTTSSTDLESGRWANFLADRSPVKIEVPGGWWRFMPVIRRGVPGSVAAELFTDPHARRPNFQVGAYTWRIEELVGFPLPAVARTALRRAPAQPYFPRSARSITADDVRRDAALRPLSTSATHILDRPPSTYGRLREPAPVHRWEYGDVRVDILAAATASKAVNTGSKLTYRIFQQGMVMFAGDDVTIPPGTSPRSTAAIKRVVAGLAGAWAGGHLTEGQQEFIASHGREIVDAADRQPRPPEVPPALASAGEPASLEVADALASTELDLDPSF